MQNQFEELRDYLMSYFGTAMKNGFPMAVIELTKVEMASNEELIEIAKRYDINVNILLLNAD